MKTARKCILNIKPYIPGKPIEEVKRELGLKEVVKLASNENPLGPSPKACAALRNAVSLLNRYPDGDCFYLKRRISEKLGVDRGNIVMGNGSDEVIVFASRAFLEPGDEAIIAKPTFLIYEIASRIAGANVIEVPLKNFRYDLAAIKRAINEKTKMIFIGNPDNPTGVYITSDEVKKFLKGLPKDIIVFFDEAYYEFARSEPDYPDMLQYIDSNNIIITRTFSKAYGLAGIRVGYGIAKKPIADCLNRVREPFNVNSLAQAAALGALSDDIFLERSIKAVKSGKIYLYKELDKLGFEYIKSAANFILVDVKQDGASVFKKLLKSGIIVRDMSAWKLDNFIRVTIGLPDENKKFIKALKEELA